MDTRSQLSLVLGIDTGGTYTDGVLLEYHSRRVLAAHKSLTTKRDFSIGIEEVIEAIDIEDPAAIEMVSIHGCVVQKARVAHRVAALDFGLHVVGEGLHLGPGECYDIITSPDVDCVAGGR